MKDMPREIAVYRRTDSRYEFATHDTPLNYECVKYIRADTINDNKIEFLLSEILHELRNRK